MSRTCRMSGCERPLAHWNRSGVCGPCKSLEYVTKRFGPTSHSSGYGILTPPEDTPETAAEVLRIAEGLRL